MKTPDLEQLEVRLQTLIEVNLVDLLPGQRLEDLIARQLAQAVRANLNVQPDGTRQAPNVFTLIAHPDAIEKWKADPRLLSGLEAILQTVVQEAGLVFAAPPTISVAADEEVGPEDMRVIASQEVLRVGETQSKGAAEEETNIPENAFLIVEGVKVFPLNRTVINIGRRLDNHLVIEDPRVSRNHVQLRAIKGRFVLFDLNSTGGTYVNGQRVTQSVLYAGDVISLAGVPLIFGQDNPPPRPDLANTSPLSSASGDRPTAILKADEEPKPKKK